MTSFTGSLGAPEAPSGFTRAPALRVGTGVGDGPPTPAAAAEVGASFDVSLREVLDEERKGEGEGADDHEGHDDAGGGMPWFGLVAPQAPAFVPPVESPAEGHSVDGEHSQSRYEETGHASDRGASGETAVVPTNPIDMGPPAGTGPMKPSPADAGHALAVPTQAVDGGEGPGNSGRGDGAGIGRASGEGIAGPGSEREISAGGGRRGLVAAGSGEARASSLEPTARAVHQPVLGEPGADALKGSRMVPVDGDDEPRGGDDARSLPTGEASVRGLGVQQASATAPGASMGPSPRGSETPSDDRVSDVRRASSELRVHLETSARASGDAAHQPVAGSHDADGPGAPSIQPSVSRDLLESAIRRMQLVRWQHANEATGEVDEKTASSGTAEGGPGGAGPVRDSVDQDVPSPSPFLGRATTPHGGFGETSSGERRPDGGSWARRARQTELTATAPVTNSPTDTRTMVGSPFRFEAVGRQAFVEMPEPAENLSRLVHSMRVQARDGVTHASVRLNPEHLGEVSIVVRLDAGVVTAVVRAEAGDVRQWLRGQEEQIRAALADQGVTLDEFVVESEGRGQPREDPSPDRERANRRRRNVGARAEGVRFEVIA